VGSFFLLVHLNAATVAEMHSAAAFETLIMFKAQKQTSQM
jgi:hypothetical protein